MATTFSVDDFSEYRTEIELTDFHVVDAQGLFALFLFFQLLVYLRWLKVRAPIFKGQAIIVANGACSGWKK